MAMDPGGTEASVNSCTDTLLIRNQRALLCKGLCLYVFVYIVIRL